MPSTPPPSRRPRALFATAALCLALGACREDARFARREPIDPLPATLAAPGFLEPAPDAWELAGGHPAPVGRLVSRDNAYAWAERAYALDHVFYEAPPDYGFDYEDTQPWAWETPDDWALYVEPLEVGNRYYYYEPGADHPYFVRDPDYGYGFDDVGRVVVVYDVAGRLMPERYVVDRADVAGRYFTRARALRNAAERAQRRPVAEDRWFARRSSLEASQASWIQAAQAQGDWRRYRERTDKRELRRFEPDRERRVAETRRFEREWRADRERRGGQPREDQRGQRAFAAREDRGGEPAGRPEAPRFERAARADDQRRQAEARIEGERREQAQRERRAEGERRQEQARQDRGRAEADARRQRADGERRQEQARMEGERRQRAQREQRADGERRQAQARAEGERRQEQVRQERGRAEADARRQQAQREQRAEGERRQAQARQERGRQEQARVEGERRQEQARQERARADTAERHAQPAADRQRSPDRGNDGGGQRPDRGNGGGHGRDKKD